MDLFDLPTSKLVWLIIISLVYFLFVGIQFVGVLFCGDYLCTVCGPSGRQQWWGACQDGALIRHMASSVSRFHTLVGTRKQHWFNVTIILASLTILSSAIFDLCYPDSYHYPWAWVWWRQWWAWVDTDEKRRAR